MEDSEGCNAIEYAIEHDMDLNIIKAMQRVARDDWRALKANGNGKKHEELAQDIERGAHEARGNIALFDIIGSSFGQDNSARQPPAHYKSCFAKTA